MPPKTVALVVEDEKPLLEVIKTKLAKSGFDTVSARTVKQALEMMKEVPNIKVVWLDHYLLGDENGLDFVAKVKTHAAWKGIPIFVVSNTASADKVSSYLHLGIAKYFTKSESRLDEIIADIKSTLSRRD